MEMEMGIQMAMALGTLGMVILQLGISGVAVSDGLLTVQLSSVSGPGLTITSMAQMSKNVTNKKPVKRRMPSQFTADSSSGSLSWHLIHSEPNGSLGWNVL